jgi:transposase
LAVIPGEEVTAMGGRKLAIHWHETAEELLARYRAERNVHIARRLQALYLLHQGRRIPEAAGIVGVSTRSIEKWVAWYRKGGLGEVVRRQRGGLRLPARQPLNPDQLARLAGHAAQVGFSTVKEAVEWVSCELGVRLSEGQMSRLFKKLGLRRKVLRPMAEQADAGVQARWKKGGLVRRWSLKA